jgi:hypothetical protein
LEKAVRTFCLVAALAAISFPALADCKRDIAELEPRAKGMASGETRAAALGYLSKAAKAQPASEIDCLTQVSRARKVLRDGVPPKDPIADPKGKPVPNR